MARIFGFVVGGVWLVFTLMALRASAAGWTAGHTDVGFWYGVIAFFLGTATTVAIVGTLRHRRQGPLK